MSPGNCASQIPPCVTVCLVSAYYEEERAVPFIEVLVCPGRRYARAVCVLVDRKQRRKKGCWARHNLQRHSLRPTSSSWVQPPQRVLPAQGQAQTSLSGMPRVETIMLLNVAQNFLRWSLESNFQACQVGVQRSSFSYFPCCISSNGRKT